MEFNLDSVHLTITNPNDSVFEIHEATSKTITNQRIDTLFLDSKLDFSKYGIYKVNADVFYRYNYNHNIYPRSRSGFNFTGKIRTTKLSLPIVQGFEEAAQETYYSYSRDSIPGVPEASFYIIQGGGDTPNTIGFPACYTCQSLLTGTFAQFHGWGENKLVFTYDLSDYSSLSDQLSFKVKLSGHNLNVPHWSSQVQIMMKGNADQPWIKIYDWAEDKVNEIDDRIIHINDISRLLRANGQDYGTAFQLLFRTKSLRDFYPELQLFYIDDVMVFERPPIDAAIGVGEVPAVGILTENLDPFSAQIINRRTNDLSEIPITIHITLPNGDVLEHTEVVTDTIAPGKTINYAFQQGVNLSEVGPYQIQFSSNIADDSDSTNNYSKPYFTGKLRPYQGDLPFIVDFENETDNEILVVEGQTENTFFTDAFSRGSSFRFDDEFGSYIYYRNATGSGRNENLIFTIDLSDHSVGAYQPELSFRYWHREFGFGTREDDAISIRGSMDMPWIPLFYFRDNEHQLIYDITIPNISDTLTNDDQEYGESFQIKFGRSSEISLKLDDIFFGENVLSSEGVGTSTFSFPNPTPDYVVLLDEKSVIEIKSVQLTDLLGRIMPISLDKKSDQKIELDLRSLKNRIYFLTWMENGERQRRKIIRE
ncbi:MAG: T9SS type A sorting domain-containing protein [Cytophagales bacterium]|nr:T9SS type A sorting domain-containing protein [Cytophagales bacterium]